VENKKTEFCPECFDGMTTGNFCKNCGRRLSEIQNICFCPQATINGQDGSICEFFDIATEKCQYGED